MQGGEIMTETIESVRDARNHWTDYVSGQGVTLPDEAEETPVVESTVNLGKIRKDYSREGMENLARLGYLREGNLTGTETVMHKGIEYPVSVIPLNLNTQNEPNLWSMVIPSEKGTRGIFLPPKYPEDEE